MFPTIIIKEGVEVAIHMRDLSVPHVGNNTWISVLSVRMDILDVVLGVIR